MIWPPDYVAEMASRQNRLRKIRCNPVLQFGLPERYREDPVAWINHWAVTYDPRKAGSDTPTTMPFIPFPKQNEMTEFLLACVHEQQNGLIEKARDMGATWVCCAFSVWLWLYWPGASVGWGSRKEQLVDKIGDPDSIFEKMRIIIRNLPSFMLPRGFSPGEHMTYMRIVNPENGATITGEAGDNIGRGGRKLIYFKDESAHYERPEKIEAALADNTNCQIDISSVNGPGNVFNRRREAGREWIRGEPLASDCVNVLVMDWRDHPAKSQGWYDQRKAKAISDGLQHVFAQEVDRDYTAAVEGVIIPAAWVASAIDAHLRLGFDDSGQWSAGFDPYDEGGDMHALAVAKGPILHSVEAWGEGDTGAATRKVVDQLRGKNVELQYDCLGVGAGVKAEANRLAEDLDAQGNPLLPKGIKFMPWNAAGQPQLPDQRVVPNDPESPLNKDFYANLKAQGWWQLRRRFELTHRAITEGITVAPDDMISLSSSLPNLSTLRKELSQATRGRTGALRLVVNKNPPGTKSPNMADAVVMAFWPSRDPTTGFLDWLAGEHRRVVGENEQPNGA